MDEREAVPSAKAPGGQSAAGGSYRAVPSFQPRDGVMSPDDWAADPALTGHITFTGPREARSGDSEPGDERSTGRKVVAEWALWGKEPADPEYRVLRCSDGTFGSADFQGIISRYTSGTKERLPQYTVCWIPDENGHEGYLAVCIHELANRDPRLSDGRLRASRGREIEYVRLFCISYREMAKQRASYAEVIESVRERYQLGSGDTRPITVELLDVDPPPFPREIYAQAENVATLLLTTRPICILGAEHVAAEDRLHFVDAVMSLLPYGLRSTFSASTWASATAQDLKLRLFFANAERDSRAIVHETWGRPLQLDLTAPDQMPLRHYENWLGHIGAGAAAELAGQKEPVRFYPDEISAMVARLPKERRVTDVFEELADGVHHGRLPMVQAARDRLKKQLGSPLVPAQRDEYRRTIERLDLFKENPKLPANTSRSVYRILLALAIGPEASYGDYCYIERCVGGSPKGQLRQAMLKLKFDSFLPMLFTYNSGVKLTGQQLMSVLYEEGISEKVPIAEFCRNVGQVRPEHRTFAYDFAVGYLRHYAVDSKAELVRHGYLADTLEAAFPDDRDAQRMRLEDTLRFVYGGMLTPEMRAALDSQPGVRHTQAFQAAVARLAARPAPETSRGAAGPGKRLRAFWRRLREARVSAATVVIGLAAIVVIVILIFVGLLVR